MHPSKVVQKNMLKAWEFTIIKLCQICFYNSLQKIFRIDNLECSVGRILLIVVLMVVLWLQLKMEIVD